MSAGFATSRLNARYVAADPLHRFVQFTFPASRDEYIRTFIDESLCRRKANPTAASRNHGNLPCELL
jgi:hypothetical protein